MKIIKDIATLSNAVKRIREKGKSLGFVPTMGALHQGHLTLINRSVAENDVTIISIFVNPTQFNNANDLEKYPRHLDKDATLVETVGADYIFAPSTDQIYSTSELQTPFDFDFQGLDQVMEGRFRPNHFNGVVQIVSKLFHLVTPNRAYFGEKDFQQLAIIHLMIKQLSIDVEIVDCPIVREENGLALSSRNQRLTTEQHKNAQNISKILFKSRIFVPDMSPSDLTRWITDEINSNAYLKVEYVDIVDTKTLQTLKKWGKEAVVCVAVFCGEVRLIDNVRLWDL